jgi:homospermidine synthase
VRFAVADRTVDGRTVETALAVSVAVDARWTAPPTESVADANKLAEADNATCGRTTSTAVANKDAAVDNPTVGKVTSLAEDVNTACAVKPTVGSVLTRQDACAVAAAAIAHKP